MPLPEEPSPEEEGVNGCNGRCCESFPMVGGPGAMTHRQIVEARDKHAHLPGDLAIEYDKYVDMLIVIGPRPEGGDLFTCRYHDPVTKRCNEYAGRPALCSAYPYRAACVHCWLSLIQLNGREISA